MQSSCRIKIKQKSVALLYTRNRVSESEVEETIHLQLQQKGRSRPAGAARVGYKKATNRQTHRHRQQSGSYQRDKIVYLQFIQCY